MFHLQQTHFGKTKLLKTFLLIISVEGKIQSHHQYEDMGAYRTYFLGLWKYPTKLKLADLS